MSFACFAGGFLRNECVAVVVVDVRPYLHRLRREALLPATDKCEVLAFDGSVGELSTQRSLRSRVPATE